MRFAAGGVAGDGAATSAAFLCGGGPLASLVGLVIAGEDVGVGEGASLGADEGVSSNDDGASGAGKEFASGVGFAGDEAEVGAGDSASGGGGVPLAAERDAGIATGLRGELVQAFLLASVGGVNAKGFDRAFKLGRDECARGRAAEARSIPHAVDVT